jgi:hypothetical protein
MSTKHTPKERPRAFMLGCVEKLVRRGLFNNPPPVDQNNAVSDFSREPHFVRNAKHGHAFFCEADHGGQDLLHDFRIQSRSWFIEEHDGRLHAQRTRYGDPLLLAAG